MLGNSWVAERLATTQGFPKHFISKDKHDLRIMLGFNRLPVSNVLQLSSLKTRLRKGWEKRKFPSVVYFVNWCECCYQGRNYLGRNILALKRQFGMNNLVLSIHKLRFERKQTTFYCLKNLNSVHVPRCEPRTHAFKGDSHSFIPSIVLSPPPPKSERNRRSFSTTTQMDSACKIQQ
jgi:hypothetical protein